MNETTTKPAGDAALAWIQAALASGRTVNVATVYRVVRVTPTTARAWADRGDALFRVTAGDLEMASGAGWVRLTMGPMRLVRISATEGGR